MDRISVLIVNYNYGKYIRNCLESVFSQTVKAELEVIVVDDGSTDNSVDVVGEFSNVKCIQLDHSGVSVARNRALAEATGDYLAFLDADDMWNATKLERQLQHLKSNPECPVVFTAYENFIQAPLTGQEDWVKRCIKFAEIDQKCLPTALFRRAAVEKLGLFDSELNRCEDTDWTGRMEERGLEGDYLDEIMYLRRLHGSNLMNRTAQETAKEIMGVNMRKVREKVRIDARRAKFLPDGISIIICARSDQKDLIQHVKAVYNSAKALEIPHEVLLVNDTPLNTADFDNCETIVVHNIPKFDLASAYTAGVIKAKYSCVCFYDYKENVSTELIQLMYNSICTDNEKFAAFYAKNFERGSISFSVIKKDAFRKVGFFDCDAMQTWIERFKASSCKYTTV